MAHLKVNGDMGSLRPPWLSRLPETNANCSLLLETLLAFGLCGLGLCGLGLLAHDPLREGLICPRRCPRASLLLAEQMDGERLAVPKLERHHDRGD